MRFQSFVQMLTYYAQNGNGTALIYDVNGERHTLTYSALLERVQRCADELRATGKTSIGILCTADLECIVTIFAAAAAKMQVVMLDGGLNDAALTKLVQAADVDMLLGTNPATMAALTPYLTEGVEADAGRILFFTSGTTSMSKAVVLTEESLCASAYNGSAKLPLTPDDTLLCLLPLAHVFGFVCSLLWGLSCGAAVALSRGAHYMPFDLQYFDPTAVSVVPMLLGFLLKQKLLNDRLSLILVGAGDCPQSLLDAAAAMGKRVSFGYGLTETSSGVAISVSGDPHAMEICPDDTIEIAPDGEILIQAPTCIMQGYYKDQESTDAVLQDGWFHSGDLGYLDHDGRLHITGRKKEMLVLPNGTKIFLPDYEHELAKALDNAELAVILLKAKPVLVIQELPEKRKELMDKVAQAMKKLPRAHQIADVIFTDQPLPRTATGKIKRWEIQKTEEEKNGKAE
ncbi:MAG: AMP-binding protein [Eubacterium sp.]|nr:AMP-binding protein [Eubacterium sp.]